MIYITILKIVNFIWQFSGMAIALRFIEN
jgi:hypothetical protein